MRSFDSDVVIYASAPSREFSIRATFRDNSIKFDSDIFDSDDTDSDFISVDSFLDVSISYDDSFYNRVAKLSDNDLVISSHSSDPREDWGVTSWDPLFEDSALTTTHVSDSDASPSTDNGGAVMFVNAAGVLLFADEATPWDTTVLDSDVSMTVGSSKIVMDGYSAGGLASQLYVLAGPDSDNTQRLFRYYADSDGSSSWEFPGRIYQDSDSKVKLSVVGPITSNGVTKDLVFFMEMGRLMYISVIDGASDSDEPVWGEITSVLPLDVVDVEWSTFELGGADWEYSNEINKDIVFISGRIRRNDLNWDLFLTGVDERFTVDRWSLITQDVTMLSDPGELLAVSTGSGKWLVYTGVGAHSVASLDRYINVDSDVDSDDIAVDVDILTGLNFSQRINSPSTFSSGVGAQATDFEAYLDIGRQLKIDIGWGDSDQVVIYDQFGTFGIDVKQPLNESTGFSIGIGGRGWASKRLDQWESDQSYEYWSQTKMYTHPYNVEDVNTFVGQWRKGDDSDFDSDDTYLYIDDLNVLGYLYSVFKPERNMLVQARFRSPAGDHSYYTGRRGVGTNYYRVSRLDAANELDINSEEAEDSDFGHNAIVAIYSANEHDSDSDGIGLYYVRHDQYMLMASASVSLNDSDLHWLSIQFQDGAIQVRYRYDSDTQWTTAINHVFTEVNSPWYRDSDRLGKAVAFLENDTPSSLTPGFSSTDQAIPVYDITVFPDSFNTVQVNNEYISYTKTYNQLPTHSLLTADGSDTDWWNVNLYSKRHANAPSILATSGLTWSQAVINNAHWTTGLQLFQGSFDNVGNGTYARIGHTAANTVYGAQAWNKPDFEYIPEGVAISVAIVGSPGYPLYIYYLHDDWDNQGSPYFGGSTHIATATIDSDDLADFDSDFVDDDEGVIKLRVGFFVDTDSYPSGFMPTRGDDNDWIAVTTMPPRSTAYSSFHDTDNYYVVSFQTAPMTNSLGISRFWGTSGWGYSYNDTDFVVGNQAGEDVQLVNEIWGFSPYVENGTFEIYVHAPNVPGDSDGGLERAFRDEMDRLFLVVTHGPGKGATFEITDYDALAPDQWVFDRTNMDPDEWKNHVGDESFGSWVSPAKGRFGLKENPSGIIVPEASYVRVFHTLGGDYDDPLIEGTFEGITRGQPNIFDSDNPIYIESIAAAHGEALVSLTDTARVRIDRMTYHSSNVDNSLEEIVRELAAKAGIFTVTAEKTVDSSDSDYDFMNLGGWSVPVWKNPKNNTVLTLQAPTADTDAEFGLLFRSNSTDSDLITEGYRVSYAFGDQSLKFYKWVVADSDYTLQQSVPLGKDATGPMMFSVWEDHFSVWDTSGLLWTFTDTDYQSGQFASIVAYHTDAGGDVDLSTGNDWPSVDRLVDGFIFDMGSRGSQLLSGVLGKTDSRIAWRDTSDGGLYISRVKTRIDDSDDYDYEIDSDIALKEGERFTDLDQKTLVRSEGAGRESAIFATEVADFAEMADRGFLFSYHNAPLALSEWETDQEASYAMDDFLSSSHVMTFDATLDPRIESNDVIRVGIPGILDYSVIVDSISFSAISGQASASIDMTIRSRVAIF